MRTNTLLILALTLAVAPAFSDDASPTSQSGAEQSFGAQSQAWLNLQQSGAAASKVERSLPGEVGTKVYERYVNSFSHPIPEYYDRQSFSANGSK